MGSKQKGPTMRSEWFELAIIAFILIGIGMIVWKGGAANPVGTGRLQGAVRRLQGEVKGIGLKLEELDSDACKKGDFALLQQAFEAEQERVKQAFDTLERVTLEITEIRDAIGRKHAVIDALAESVRVISQELGDVSRRLDQLSGMNERIDANQRAIEAMAAQLPGLAGRQEAMAAQIASTNSTVLAIEKQLGRIYDVIVPKGMGS
jgi:chromosome segregation ATPase